MTETKVNVLSEQLNKVKSSIDFAERHIEYLYNKKEMLKLDLEEIDVETRRQLELIEAYKVKQEKLRSLACKFNIDRSL